MVFRFIAHYFKADATTEYLIEAVQRAKALQGEIPEIRGLRVELEQPDADKANRLLKMTLAFETEADMKRYCSHPAHVAFGHLIKPMRELKVQSIADTEEMVKE